MTPRDFARRLAAFPTNLSREVVAAETLTARNAKAVAVQLSSGTRTAAQLRRAGNPYARRDPTAANPETLNAQTGLLKNSWQSEGPQSVSGEVRTKVYNTVPYGRYLVSGTKAMIARPIVDAVKKAVKPARDRRLSEAVKRAWSQSK